MTKKAFGYHHFLIGISPGHLLPTGSEESEVLGVGSFPDAIYSLLSKYENYCIIIE